MTFPFESTKNLAKFHVISLANYVLLSNNSELVLKYLYISCVFGPLTSIFSEIKNYAPIFPIANAYISIGVPGSCPPN
jgi:hypothetical protein